MVTMMKLKWILLGTVLILMGGVSAEGQSIIRNSFLGARNVALASANMAEPHDISSIYSDPATIAFLENPSVVLNQLQGNEGEMQENLAFPLVYDRSQMLAFGAELYTLGEFTNTSQARRYAIGYDIAFAQRVASTVSVGGSVSFRHGVVSQVSRANAASYTLGIDYVPNEDVSYGLALGGLGTGIEFVNDNSIVTPVQVTLPRVLQVSAVMRFPLSHRWSGHSWLWPLPPKRHLERPAWTIRVAWSITRSTSWLSGLDTSPGLWRAGKDSVWA